MRFRLIACLSLGCLLTFTVSAKDFKLPDNFVLGNQDINSLIAKLSLQKCTILNKPYSLLIKNNCLNIKGNPTITINYDKNKIEKIDYGYSYKDKATAKLFNDFIDYMGDNFKKRFDLNKDKINYLKNSKIGLFYSGFEVLFYEHNNVLYRLERYDYINQKGQKVPGVFSFSIIDKKVYMQTLNFGHPI